MSACGIKRCWCEDEKELDVKAVKHAETVITRWLRNDLPHFIDGDALAESAASKFIWIQNDLAWREGRNE